ncbi:MAG: LuxR C-terminal-related transcriptional regulator [Actinomycetota bacterium]|nr:LuxR C-terminal-related transcriptional regulator [Actinomycetota bacterium]
MAEGLTNAAIARRLVLGERTIESHVSSSMRKLGITSTPDDHRRVQAVVAYLRAAH